MSARTFKGAGTQGDQPDDIFIELRWQSPKPAGDWAAIFMPPLENPIDPPGATPLPHPPPPTVEAPPTVPEISVVIVNYNVKDFLLQCLRSIELAAGPFACEVIVVDNNSTDGSVDYLEPLFPGVRFVRLPENLGFGRANNVGIEKARGEFILLLNPDTMIEERTLEVMLSYMRAHPQAGVAGCRVLNPDGTLQPACRRSFPTPWAAFCKVFGLQRLFPHSRLFSQYNQGHVDDRRPHFVDAVSGSFMFIRRAALAQTGVFDPEFFMFGEDLDLCFRLSQAGWKIGYTPDTAVIHYKGESTKRSSVDRVEVFYRAMEIFARKHHRGSVLLLPLLRLGIFLRSLIAYANRYRRTILVILLDALSINVSMLIATGLRFGDALGFPPYAYPAVFLVLTAATVCSMIAVGEYFEAKPSLRGAFAGLMVDFFLLTALTYYFREYAFSRGVLLMTISFAILFMGLVRASLALYDKSLGKEADRRIAIVGMNEASARIIQALQTAERRNADVVGVVAGAATAESVFAGLPVLGHISYLSTLIDQYKLREVIVTDSSLQRKDVIGLLVNSAARPARFHVALDYEDIVASRIINEVSGIEFTLPHFNITRLRYRLAKRAIDLASSVFLLTVGLPLLFLVSRNITVAVRSAWNVLLGRYSLVGLYPMEDEPPLVGKIGMTGLAHISRPRRLAPEVIRELNDYYVRHYSLSLDYDILVKDLFRRRHQD